MRIEEKEKRRVSSDERKRTMTRALRRAVAGLSMTVVLVLGAPALATAAPIWDVAVHNGPSTFQPGGAGELQIHVNNVGDASARSDVDGDGTADDPMSFTVELPSGLTTRTHDTLHFNGVSTWMGDVNWHDPGWACSSSEPGESSLTCALNRDPMPPGGQAFDPWGSKAHVYVAVAENVSGVLPVRVTMSGGGAEPVSVVQPVPVGPAPDAFGVKPGSFVADAFDAQNRPERQAGSHPHRAVTAFDFNARSVMADGGTSGGYEEVTPQPVSIPVGTVRNLELRLPRGFVANPTVVAQCSRKDFSGGFRAPDCPVDSQVGKVEIAFQNILTSALPTGSYYSPLYSLVPGKGQLAAFGFKADGREITFYAELDPHDHSVVVKVPDIVATLRLHYQHLAVWGVPASPVHDPDRYDTRLFKFGASLRRPIEPFVTLPSECGMPDVTDLRAASWQDPANWTPWMASDPVELTGCDKLSFEPTVAIAADAGATDTPTGLKVDMTFPQDEQPASLGTPPLKRARVTLPEGMAINPGSADGLAACSDAQLGLGSNAPVGCPDAAKIGTATVRSPALEGEISGDVFLRSQASDDPESGQMFRLALVLRHEERGLLVKLPGSVKVDAQSGQIVTEFDDNPQLPVSSLSLQLKDGPRAPLATPSSCGNFAARSELSPWSAPNAPVVFDHPIAIDRECAARGFSPALSAGTQNPVGGASSTFTLTLDRPERQQALATVSDVVLPPGLVAKLRQIPRCDGLAAETGACDPASRVGRTTVAVGPGSAPLFVPQPGREASSVYLGGPYKGAPFSLVIRVPAQAGPFDLGTVVVRSALFVDPTDAHVTVKTDPLPQILKGVPISYRKVNVTVDRPGFMLNPTSCAPKRIAALTTSTAGTVAGSASRFQVGDCRALALKPKLKLGLTGRKQLTDGKHPRLKATLTQRAGQAGLKKVAVKLPLSLALDPDNADGLCEHVESIKAEPNCPKSSIVGRAKAWTPLLDKPLEGPVYFAKNVRVDKKSGRQIRTLPKLVLALRGEVALNVIGNSATTKDGRLVNTFATVPDAPVSRFELSLAGGKKGILVVNGKACNRSRVAGVEIDGHNGRSADHKPKLTAPCGKAKKAERGPRR